MRGPNSNQKLIEETNVRIMKENQLTKNLESTIKKEAWMMKKIITPKMRGIRLPRRTRNGANP